MEAEFLPVRPTNWLNNRVHFYKYMTAETATIVLKNRTLRWSAPSLFNDPFDAQFNMTIPSDLSNIKPLALEKMWMGYKGDITLNEENIVSICMKALSNSGITLSKSEFFKEFGESFDEGYERMLSYLPIANADAAKILLDIKLLCLTIRADNSLMWSHYADSHRGVVLRFRSIPALDSPYGMAKPVDYVEAIPNLISESQIADIFAGVTTMDKAGILDRAIYTKSAEWSYEEEWRVFSGSGRKPGEMFEDLPFSSNELDGLIFGVKTPESSRLELSKLAGKYPNISLFNASKNPTGFTLKIDPC